MAENYIPRLYEFLREVACNNNREWFRANKSRYDELRELWLADLDRLLSMMSVYEPGLVSQSAKTCAYRFYRDTRFSLDKSPYKTFFSAAISPMGRNAARAAYYLQIDIRPEESGLYGGLWCPDAAMLRKMRNAIVDNIEEFQEIINNPKLEKYYPGWLGDKLKTIPKGWDKNHPQAELLKLKSYGRYCRCDERFFSGERWVETAAERFHVIKPLIDFINYSLDEDV